MSDTLLDKALGKTGLQYLWTRLKAMLALKADITYVDQAVAPEIFWATQGVTTFEELYDAYQAGKSIVVRVENTADCYFTRMSALDTFEFGIHTGTQFLRLTCNATYGWNQSAIVVPSKTSELTNDSGFITTDTDTTYPLDDATIDGSFMTSFRTQTKGDAENGWYVAPIRCDTAGVDGAPQYSSGLAMGVSDTQGYISFNFSQPEAYVGGGNGDTLNWVKKLAFADDIPTDYATEAYVTNAMEEAGLTPEIFWATPETTTYAQILEAYNAGKVINSRFDGLDVPLVDFYNNSFIFGAQEGLRHYGYTCTSSGWSYDVLDMTQILRRTISMPVASWTQQTDGTFTQNVTVSGGTSNTLVTLQPTPAQIIALQAAGVTALMVNNNSGTFVATAIGAKPSAALSLQASIHEIGT